MEWLSNAWTIVLVALGIGGVIFVHECGHFFAARWCGVRVECFSLGFGPKVLGWRRGPTTYQLALLPLGGFVKMAGEEGASGAGPAPDELPAKSVGQRFLIYSGGVIANVLLGLIVFPILFAHGVPFPEPVVGGTIPGSPAWQAGIEPGTTVLTVNERRITKFTDISTEIALGSPERADLELLRPDGERQRMTLFPVKDESLGAFSIGVLPGFDRQGRISVEPGSAAERAGLKEGDRLLSIEGGLAGLTLLEQLQLQAEGGAPLRGRFERDGHAFDATIEPGEQGAASPARLGILPEATRVEALRDEPLVARLGLAKDDRLVSVNGRPIRRDDDLLRALAGGVPAVRIEYRRGREARTAESGPLAPEEALRVARGVALGFDQDSTRVTVLDGSPAQRAGLRDGDRIVAVAGAEVKAYDDVKSAIQKQKGESLALVVERGAEGTTSFVNLTATLSGWKTRSYGLGLQRAEYVYKVDGPVQAVKEGWLASWTFIQEGWLTLKRIFNREVSGDNIGGIITIGVVSHKFAETGLVSLLFFLCMLSMNLAFLNVLPIPVLDGGHLLFLLIEKIKGSPVSERVLGYSQMVGIVLILSLMVYVTFNDVMRWIVK